MPYIADTYGQASFPNFLDQKSFISDDFCEDFNQNLGYYKGVKRQRNEFLHPADFSSKQSFDRETMSISAYSSSFNSNTNKRENKVNEKRAAVFAPENSCFGD